MITVMIIEDDLSLLALYRDRLKTAGFTVLTEYDGQKGLERALMEKPQVLLIDLGLPHMSGLEIMKQIRNDSWGVAVPIIVLAQHDSNDDILNKILEFKPSYYLVKKDRTADEVVERVKQLTAQVISK